MILKYENYGPTENYGLDILYLELLCAQETAHCRLHLCTSLHQHPLPY